MLGLLNTLLQKRYCNDGICHIDNVPDEILIEIFLKVGKQNRVNRLNMISKKWNRVWRDAYFMKLYFHQVWRHREPTDLIFPLFGRSDSNGGVVPYNSVYTDRHIINMRSINDEIKYQEKDPEYYQSDKAIVYRAPHISKAIMGQDSGSKLDKDVKGECAKMLYEIQYGKIKALTKEDLNYLKPGEYVKREMYDKRFEKLGNIEESYKKLQEQRENDDKERMKYMTRFDIKWD